MKTELPANPQRLSNRGRNCSMILLMASAILILSEASHNESLAQRQERLDTIVKRVGPPRRLGIGHLSYDGLTIGELEGSADYTFGNILDLGVGPNGSIYVLENSSLRQYDGNGKYARTIGRVGSGPGEFLRPAGMAVARDGRVVLLDPQQKRVIVYAPGGKPTRTITMRFKVTYGSDAVSVGPSGTIAIINDLPLSVEEQMTGAWPRTVLRLDSLGRILDTLPTPATLNWPPPLTIKRAGKGWFGTHVPYLARGVWYWSPLGYFVTGRNDRYEIDLLEPGKPVLRIARNDVTPVPISNEERAAQEAYHQQLLDSRPGVQIGKLGPVPRVKPFFNGISFDEDGRVLVLVAGPSERFDPAEKRGRSGKPVPQIGWREPLLIDVFETDGVYVGRFAIPYGVDIGRLVIKGERAWAVVRDEFDVEYIKRFKIVWGT